MSLSKNYPIKLLVKERTKFQMPTVFLEKNLKGKFCLSPFVSIQIDPWGNVSLCGCDTWMPTKIGNLFNQTLDQLLSSEIAKSIRKSIIQGTYEYCNEKTCGIIQNNELIKNEQLPPNVHDLIEDSTSFAIPHEIVISGDLTCNLSCPSCRTSVIRTSDSERAQQQQLGNILFQNLFTRPSDVPIKITVSTSGEVFASPFLLQFLSNIDPENFPNLKLKLQTNGLLARKRWHLLAGLVDRVSEITITFDAARPNTYEILRRGGTWPDLLDNLKFLSDQRQTGMKLYTRMVVQQANWNEILEFYDISQQFDADRVEYVRITDWGTYGTEFSKHDVLDPNHPEYTAAQHMIRQVSKLPKSWVAGGISKV